MSTATVDITSSATPAVVEAASQVSITGQTLPNGSSGQTLVNKGDGTWQPGYRVTVSSATPSGGTDGDLWFQV